MQNKKKTTTTTTTTHTHKQIKDSFISAE